MQKKKVYRMTIEPSLVPKKRHEIEDVLKSKGYKVIGGGTHTNMSQCNIAFEEGK